MHRNMRFPDIESGWGKNRHVWSYEKTVDDNYKTPENSEINLSQQQGERP